MAIYIAVEPKMYRRGIMHLFPRDHRERAGEVLSAIAAVLRKWLVTQLIAMVTLGVMVTIMLLVLGVKAAVALGLYLLGLFEFIPTIGPIMSALPAIAMGFLDSPEKALSVIIAYVLVQFFENHLLIPLLYEGWNQPAAGAHRVLASAHGDVLRLPRPHVRRADSRRHHHRRAHAVRGRRGQ